MAIYEAHLQEFSKRMLVLIQVPALTYNGARNPDHLGQCIQPHALHSHRGAASDYGFKYHDITLNLHSAFDCSTGNVLCTRWPERLYTSYQIMS